MEIIRLQASFNRLKDFTKIEDIQKFGTTDIDEKFTNIYVDDVWGKGKCESKSGPGSTLNYTKVIRAELPNLIEKYGIKIYLTRRVAILIGCRRFWIKREWITQGLML